MAAVTRLIDVPSGPSRDPVPVTPSDSTTYSPAFRAVAVCTGGNLHVMTGAGTERTFTNLPNGFVLTGAISKVYSTDTTAADIIGYP